VNEIGLMCVAWFVIGIGVGLLISVFLDRRLRNDITDIEEIIDRTKRRLDRLEEIR